MAKAKSKEIDPQLEQKENIITNIESNVNIDDKLSKLQDLLK